MGFSVGRFAKIWKMEDRGTYAIANLSISKKDKNSNTYTTEFKDGFVAIVGRAYEDLKDAVIDENKGLSVKLVSCDVTNVYTSPTGKVSYNPHYTVFAVELPNASDSDTREPAKKKSNTADDFVNIPDGNDEELPFN